MGGIEITQLPDSINSLPRNSTINQSVENHKLQIKQPLPLLDHKLKIVLESSYKYPKYFSDALLLLRSIIPSSLPLVVSLEFIRKLYDEEISKQGLLSNISKGGDPELSFIKVPPVVKKMQKILTPEEKRLLKEEEYLNSISLEERQYLLDMRIILKDKFDEILRLAIQPEGIFIIIILLIYHYLCKYF